MSERKLDIAKRIINEHFCDANCGIFNCHNNVGDHMTNIYDDGELLIDVCYDWLYFEVFGLSDADFIELKNFYDIIRADNILSLLEISTFNNWKPKEEA